MGGDSGVQIRSSHEAHLLDRKGPRLGVSDRGANAIDVYHQHAEQKLWSNQCSADYALPPHPPLLAPNFPHVGVQSGGAADSAAFPRHDARGNVEATLQGAEELAYGDRRRRS